MGFIGVFVVAHRQERREERAAGELLVLEMRRFLTFAEALDALPDPDTQGFYAGPTGVLLPASAAQKFREYKERLRIQPHLSTLFETSMARVMGTDVPLSVLLGTFQTAVHAIQGLR